MLRQHMITLVRVMAAVLGLNSFAMSALAFESGVRHNDSAWRLESEWAYATQIRTLVDLSKLNKRSCRKPRLERMTTNI